MLRDPGKGPPPAKRFGRWVEKGKHQHFVLNQGPSLQIFPHLCEHVSLQRGSLGRGAKADTCAARLADSPKPISPDPLNEAVSAGQPDPHFGELVRVSGLHEASCLQEAAPNTLLFPTPN